MSKVISLPKALLTIVFYGVAFGSFRMLVGGVSVLYLLSNNVDLVDLGLLKSFQFGLIMIIDLPLSYMTDRYSRKLSTILGILFGALWLLTTAFATHLWQFYVAEALNAISLSLFNGAYIAYLIDTKNKLHPTLSNKDLLSYDNKYNSLGMAICAFVGATCLAPTSNTIWIIAGGLLLMVGMGAVVYLPSDTHNPAPTPLKPHTSSIKSNIAQLLSAINEKRQIGYGLLATSILLICFQTLLQLWQPIIKAVNPSNFGWIYGVFFSVVSLAQLLSSYAITSTIKHKYTYVMMGVLSSLLLMALTMVFLPPSMGATLLILVSLFVLFFGIKCFMLETSARFHDIIPDTHRSLLDSMGFFISRTLLLVIFPIITLLTNHVGFIALPCVLFLFIALYVPINRYFKQTQTPICDDAL